MARMRMQRVKFSLILVLMLCSLNAVSAEPEPVSAEVNLLNGKIQLIFLHTRFFRNMVGEYIFINDVLPGTQDVTIIQPPTEMISVVRWTGKNLWVVAEEAALGENLVLTMTPEKASNGEIAWTCQSTGSVPEFPRDCTDVMSQ